MQKALRLECFFITGGRWWIRTTEVIDDRFTVWSKPAPLGHLRYFSLKIPLQNTKNPLREPVLCRHPEGISFAYFCAAGLTLPLKLTVGLPPTCSAGGRPVSYEYGGALTLSFIDLSG